MHQGRRTSIETCQLPLRRRAYGILLTVVVLFGCEQVVVSVVEVTDVQLFPDRMTLMEGERDTVSVVLTESGGSSLSNRAVTWAVDDEEVASVTANGVVEGRRRGVTRIHATSGGVGGTAEITVVPGPEIQVSVRTVDIDVSSGDGAGVTREVEVTNAGNGTLDRLFVRLKEGAASWLEARLLGTTAPTRLRLSTSAEGLAAGAYEALVAIESPSARNGSIDVRVRLTVGAESEPEPEPEDSCDITDRTFGNDVEISGSSTCTFTNVRVRGDLKLRKDARLIASELTVDGNIEADGADELRLTLSRIEGDVEFEKGGRVIILESDVGGKMEIKSNRGRIDLRDNTVEDDVKLEKNREGPFTLFRNEIDGKLVCKDNTPPPTGSGNVVGENEEGQCRGLS